mmetsp:Transcript_36126/g.114872  ORF Transcript_36126/g.114872 Transcript_36126/m.114872 type:complete len:219 (+) Transcript_36126:145-801(+)
MLKPQKRQLAMAGSIGLLPLVVLQVTPHGPCIHDVIAPGQDNDTLCRQLLLPEDIVIPVELAHQYVCREDLPTHKVRHRQSERVDGPTVEKVEGHIRLCKEEAYGVQEHRLRHDVPSGAEHPTEDKGAVGVRHEVSTCMAVSAQHRFDGFRHGARCQHLLRAHLRDLRQLNYEALALGRQAPDEGQVRGKTHTQTVQENDGWGCRGWHLVAAHDHGPW